MEEPQSQKHSFDVTLTAENLYDQDKQQQKKTASVKQTNGSDHWVTIGHYAHNGSSSAMTNCAHEIFMPAQRDKFRESVHSHHFDEPESCMCKPGVITHCMHFAFETVIMLIITVLAVLYVLFLSGYNPYEPRGNLYTGEKTIPNAGGNPIAKNAGAGKGQTSREGRTSAYDKGSVTTESTLQQPQKRQIRDNLNMISEHLKQQKDVRDAFGENKIKTLAQSRAIVEKDVLHIVADFALRPQQQPKIPAPGQRANMAKTLTADKTTLLKRLL